jgi:hypothetical protein
MTVAAAWYPRSFKGVDTRGSLSHDIVVAVCGVQRPALLALLSAPTHRNRDAAVWAGCVAYPAVTHGDQRVIPTSWPYSQNTYEAFAAMKRGGFAGYCCGDCHAPHVLVAAYNWGSHGYMDVINIRGADRVTAARLPHTTAWTSSPPAKLSGTT